MAAFGAAVQQFTQNTLCVQQTGTIVIYVGGTCDTNYLPPRHSAPSTHASCFLP